jgi:hypothetical protein
MAVSEVCAVSEVLCSVSDGHYTEFGNSSISDEEKGRHASRILLNGDASILRASRIWGKGEAL